MFFLPRVFDVGASLVLGNPHHPKTFQLCTSSTSMNKDGCKSSLQLVVQLLITNNSAMNHTQMMNDSVVTPMLQLHDT
jgi:hypothetical protein